MQVSASIVHADTMQGTTGIVHDDSILATEPASQSSPPSDTTMIPPAAAGIDRSDVVGALRRLLDQALQGELSPREVVALVDSAAKLEGLQAGSAPPQPVYLVMYDTPEYQRLERLPPSYRRHTAQHLTPISTLASNHA